MAVPVDRPLSEREREVVELFVATAFVGAESVAESLQCLRVSGACDCGCPTVYFDSDQSGLVVAAEASVAGTDDSVLVFVNARGCLSSLEYVWIDPPPAEFPPPAALAVLAR